MGETEITVPIGIGFSFTGASTTKSYVGPTSFNRLGTGFASVEELLNYYASDAQMLRCTSLEIDMRLEIEGFTAPQIVYIALIRCYANGSMAAPYISTDGQAPVQDLLGSWLATNSRKGMAEAISIAIPGPVGGAASTDGDVLPLRQARLRKSWKVPNTGGKLYTDDEGQSAAGYRTYFGLGFTSIDTQFNTMEVRVRGVAHLRCIRKSFEEVPITLKDLLAEVD